MGLERGILYYDIIIFYIFSIYSIVKRFYGDILKINKKNSYDFLSDYEYI